MKKDPKEYAKGVHDSLLKLAETQVPHAIGEAVLTLFDRQGQVSIEAIVEHLLSSVQHLPPKDLSRSKNEMAARRLGWHPAPTAEEPEATKSDP